jgi:hypothetical protein
VFEHPNERVIGDLIELFDHFALDIGLSGGAKDFIQPRSAQIMGDHFADQPDVIQQDGKFSCGFGMRGLLLDDKPA